MLFFVVITSLITDFTDILYPKSQNSNKNLLFFFDFIVFCQKIAVLSDKCRFYQKKSHENSLRFY